MSDPKGSVTVNAERCKGCGVCVVHCPTKTLRLSASINGKGYHFAEMQNTACIGCQSCAVMCPDAVITVYKAKPQPKA